MSGQAEIYVQTEEWAGQVGHYHSGVASVRPLSTLPFSYTDLSPFKNFNQAIQNLNTSVIKYRTYVNSQSSNMLRDSENKLLDDRSGADGFQDGIRLK